MQTCQWTHRKASSKVNHTADINNTEFTKGNDKTDGFGGRRLVTAELWLSLPPGVQLSASPQRSWRTNPLPPWRPVWSALWLQTGGTYTLRVTESWGSVLFCETMRRPYLYLSQLSAWEPPHRVQAKLDSWRTEEGDASRSALWISKS